ncbi:MAG: hypothetical protein U0869_17215 [Chloroflexota bacterium]
MRAPTISGEGRMTQAWWHGSPDIDRPVTPSAEPPDRSEVDPETEAKPANPPRRHPVVAVTLATFVGLAATLLATSLVPVVTDSLGAIILLVGPFAAAGGATLAAWDRWVERRGLSVGSGAPYDPVARVAGSGAMVTGWLLGSLLRDSSRITFAGRPGGIALGPTVAWFIVTILGVLATWLLLLAIGGAVRRRFGGRVALMAVTFAFAFLGVSYLAGLLDDVQGRSPSEATGWELAGGGELMCFGYDRLPDCQPRVDRLLAWLAWAHPGTKATAIWVEGPGGDQVCWMDAGERDCEVID